MEILILILTILFSMYLGAWINEWNNEQYEITEEEKRILEEYHKLKNLFTLSISEKIKE